MRIWLVCFILGAFLTSCSNKNSVRDESGVEVKGLDEAEKNFYVVFGKKYFPISEVSAFEEIGIASWYGKKFHGKPTSTGEIYDMNAITAAHKTLPLPCLVQVLNLENQKKVLVKVNDRGPFVDGRIIDLSYAAAKELGMTRQGTAKVKISFVKTLVEEIKPKISFVQFGAFRTKKNAIKLSSLLNNKLPKFTIEVVETKDGLFKVVSSIPLENQISESKLKSKLEGVGISEYSILNRSL